MLKDIHPDAPIGALYNNAAKVATNARQAVAYEESIARVNIEIVPLVLYYGYLHWMKTLLYLSDLDYPRGSSLLQHGMSVRKVKREVYRWPLDYTYVYKEGVLQSFRDVVAPDLTLPNKIPIGHLLGSIPTVADAVAEFYPDFQHIYPVVSRSALAGVAGSDSVWSDLTKADVPGSAVVRLESGVVAHRPDPDGYGNELLTRNTRDVSYISRRVAANIGLTPTEWLTSFTEAAEGNHPQRALEDAAIPTSQQKTSDGMHGRDPSGFLALPPFDSSHPWLYHTSHGQWVGDGHAYPLWVSHLVTAYVLSTLCRYNAVEWLDIVHWNNDKDAHLVREYLASVPTFPELLETRR